MKPGGLGGTHLRLNESWPLVAPNGQGLLADCGHSGRSYPSWSGWTSGNLSEGLPRPHFLPLSFQGRTSATAAPVSPISLPRMHRV
jgi:hypothetical protein